jgi:hypothetical protein
MIGCIYEKTTVCHRVARQHSTKEIGLFTNPKNTSGFRGAAISPRNPPRTTHGKIFHLRRSHTQKLRKIHFLSSHNPSSRRYQPSARSSLCGQSDILFIPSISHLHLYTSSPHHRDTESSGLGPSHQLLIIRHGIQ